MDKIFAVLGSGMQGTASGYDIAKHSPPTKILMGDISLSQAQKSAHRINELVGRIVAEPHQVDATTPAALEAFLHHADVLVSCVPYHMHDKIAPVAIKSRTHMVDMGGNTDVTMGVLKYDAEAKAAGVTLVPDTGLAPGLVNNLATYCMEQWDETETVKLYCGGLPQHPKPPFNYKLVFNIEGLITEYTGEAVILRNGEVTLVDTLTEVEEIVCDPPVGKAEAFVTSGGTSTAPYTFEGKVQNYEYKTIRYPGHVERMRLFLDFGFWDTEPVTVKGNPVVPRELFHHLVGPRLVDNDDRDLVVVRCVAKGAKNGKPVEKQLDILDMFDERTGFSAMERTTGFTTAIIAQEIAKGNVEPGCIRYELAVPGKVVVDELRSRGVDIKEKDLVTAN